MIIPGEINVGGVVRLAINYSDNEGADTDPDTVELIVMHPNGTKSTYNYNVDSSDEVLKTSTGDYYYDFTTLYAGRHYYRWVSTGTAKSSAVEGTFVVQVSPFTGALPTDRYRAY